MKKAELLALKQLDLTNRISKLVKREQHEKVKKYKGFFRVNVENEILKVSIFLPEQVIAGVKTPAYIIFLDKSEDQFITYNLREKKWTNCMLLNLAEFGYYSEVHITRSDSQILKGYLGNETDTAWTFFCYQEKIRERQRIKRDKKQTDIWDMKMQEVHTLPKDWEHWIAATGISEHYLFYAYKKGGATEGYCSHCRKMVPIKFPKYNALGTCSKCRHKIRYKSIGKFGQIWTSNFQVELLQKCQSGIVIRTFSVSAKYSAENYQKPMIFCSENNRFFYNHQWKCTEYFWGLFKQREYRWIKGPRKYWGYYYHNYYVSDFGTLYPRTISALEKTALSRSGLPQMMRQVNVLPRNYLEALQQTPALEQIVKAGLYKMAAKLISSYNTPKLGETGSLVNMLGIDKERLRRLRKMGEGFDVLSWLQFEKEKNVKLGDELIQWFVEKNWIPDRFNFILDRMSPLQIKNYLERQKNESGESFSDILITWKDYLEMAKTLNMNVHDEILYRASKLQLRHQELVERIAKQDCGEREKELVQHYPKVQKILAAIKKKYEYHDQNYAIVVPDSIKDILLEGQVLHHCVDKAEYFDRIEQQESYPLFLRQLPDIEKRFYTLEVEPGGTIRQKRTEYDRQDERLQDAELFLLKWQKEIKKRMTKKDWSLSETSKKMREDNLEMLHNNKITIHGGEFAGQLLADILEGDLMEQSNGKAA